MQPRLLLGKGLRQRQLSYYKFKCLGIGIPVVEGDPYHLHNRQYNDS